MLSVRNAFEREEPEGVGRPRVDEPIVCGLGREGQEGNGASCHDNTDASHNGSRSPAYIVMAYIVMPYVVMVYSRALCSPCRCVAPASQTMSSRHCEIGNEDIWRQAKR